MDLMDRLGRPWTDERGLQYDSDYYTYNAVPAPVNPPSSGISGTIAPGATAVATINIESDAWFEWNLTAAVAKNHALDPGQFSTSTSLNANINVQITDAGAGRNLFNEPLPIGLIAGQATLPYVLPFPRRFKPNSTIIVTFQNYDTATFMDSVQLNLIGRKIYVGRNQPPPRRFKSWGDPRTGRLMAEDYFVYHFGFGSLANGANATVQQIIEGDSDFEARLMTGQVNATLNGGQSQGLFLWPFLYAQLKDVGSGRQLSNTAVSAPSFAGGSGLPLILPQPRIFMAKSTAQILLINNGAATTAVQSDFAIGGRKIFEFEEFA